MLAKRKAPRDGEGGGGEEDRDGGRSAPASARGAGAAAAENHGRGRYAATAYSRTRRFQWYVFQTKGDSIVFALLFFLSCYTRLHGLEWPRFSVFDEVHFGRFATLYIKGTNFFDIHPPFAKLVLAFWSRWWGYDGHFDFHGGVSTFDGDFYFHMRVIMASFGSLCAPFAFLTIRECGGSLMAAIFAAICVICDNCLLLESRLILTDPVLLSMISMSAYGIARTHNRTPLTCDWIVSLFITGLGLACAISTKWTGLGILILILIDSIPLRTMAAVGLETVCVMIANVYNPNVYDADVNEDDGDDDAARAANNNSSRSSGLVPFARNLSPVGKTLLDWALRFVFLFVFPVGFYIASWLVHIHMLPLSGPGDNMFTSEYVARLTGNKAPAGTVPLDNLAVAIYQFHVKMYVHNQAITIPHALMSNWWSWPLQLKPMIYAGGENGLVLFGHVVMWPLGCALVFSFLFYLAFLPWRPSSSSSSSASISAPLAPTVSMHSESVSAYEIISNAVDSHHNIHSVESLNLPRLLIFAFGYFVNWLPYIGIQRVCFIYHYLPAWYYSVLFSAVWIDTLLLTFSASLATTTIASWTWAKRQAVVTVDPSSSSSSSSSESVVQRATMLHTRLYLLLITVVLVVFVYYAPLSFGSPLTPQEKKARSHIYPWWGDNFGN